MNRKPVSWNQKETPMKIPQVPTGGVSFTGLLALVFVTLKLCGTIAWSWWWVTAPLWGPPALTLVIMAVALVGIFCYWLLMVSLGRTK